MGMSDRCKAWIPTEELRGIQVLQAMSYFRSPAGSNWPAIGEAESEPSPRQLIERRLTRHDVTIGIHVTEFVPRPAITALTSLGDLAKAAEEGPNPGQALLSTSRTQIQSLDLLVFAHVNRNEWRARPRSEWPSRGLPGPPWFAPRGSHSDRIRHRRGSAPKGGGCQ